jgi:acyl-CoA thioester hydrolase
VRAALIPSLRADDYPFTHRIRTRFAETDAMGIIHHGAYAAYLEEARASLLRHAGYPYEQVRTEGIDFAVLELVVQYRWPLRFDDLVDIHVTVGRLTRTTFQVGYLLTVDGETRATAVTVHGAIDPSGRAARMPAWLFEVIESLPPAVGKAAV